ncbi:MAG: ethanolamine ammonia-lyase reactivating factor EutA [Dehalococcoidia bacterium]
MHDDIFEHIHDAEGEGVTITPNPDKLDLTSVGIDIGSSTTHVVFSNIHLERHGTQMSSRYEVTERRSLYRSPVLLTPYKDAETIDVGPLAEFIERSYAEAGLTAFDINTGAVICTGEAVKKNNAEAITRLLSDQGGKFVCAMAGPHLEGVLAAHGSGALERSLEHPGETLMNVDVGGGTTKVTVVRDGGIVETGAISVGARLVAWDDEGRLTRVEGPARELADSLGIELAPGATLSDEDRRAMADALADALFSYMGRALGEAPPTDLSRRLAVTEPLSYDGPIDRVVFSGGVSEYIYERHSRDFGDLGPMLGPAVRQRLSDSGVALEESVEYIHATVLGVSEYTIQVSSSTIYLSDTTVLPVRDRQVVAPRFGEGPQTADTVAEAIRQGLVRADLEEAEQPIALSIDWREPLSFESLHALATGIAVAMANRSDDPWVLLFDQDIAGVVGAMLKEELKVSAEVVAADEVKVGDLAFVDIGQAIVAQQAVPVVVKSLVFA